MRFLEEKRCPMEIPYPKPTTLSDPYFDWHGSPQLAEILATDPAELGRDEFATIFYQNLPAANYEEGCYYVPYFLDHYQKAADFSSPNLEGFFWFIDHFRAKFEQDGLLTPILERIWTVFLRLTASFSIHRLSDAELATHGIGESYREMAPRSGAVHEMLDAFTSWPVFDAVLTRLRAHFAEVTTPEQSFWFCECAFHTRTWLWVNFGVDSDPMDRRQALFDFFHRIENFSAHYRHSFLNLENTISRGYFQYHRRLSPN
jgi:hypothetical protein